MESKIVVPSVQFLFYILLLSFFMSPRLSEARLSRRNSFDQVSHKGVFLQLPFSNPPTVRPPPYSDSFEQCPEINHQENWVDTLCGDLNKGTIPLNPFGVQFNQGSSYPFEIIKNKTLQFFRHALPVLKNDKSLPKVARYSPYEMEQKRHERTKRSLLLANEILQDVSMPEKVTWATQDSNENVSQARENRGLWQNKLTASADRFCENSHPKGSIICKLYNAVWGKPQKNRHELSNIHHQSPHQLHRKTHYFPQSAEKQSHRFPNVFQAAEAMQTPSMSGESSLLVPVPATPCTSNAEYLTPVFARNHEGSWRYVVQIPREGYFTQTVEVTKCGETRCFFMEGSCRTSPRWQSLLVAEMFYPQAAFPVTLQAKRARQSGSMKNYQVLKKNGGGPNESVPSQSSIIPPECDGVDEIGCFQVRLFYDWFLIPGSCQCWRTQFDFSRVYQSR